MAQKIVLSLVGFQGSGKSTLAKKLARYLGTTHVEVSSVVKELYSSLKREELASTRRRTIKEPDWLAMPIYEKLYPVFNEGKRTVVISGARELEIHHYLKRKDLFVIPIEIVSDPSLRLERELKLGKVKNARAFIEHELRERSLGLNEVCDDASFQINTTETSKPDDLVRKLVSLIAQKGKSVR